MNIISIDNQSEAAPVKTERTVRQALLDGGRFLHDTGIESARLDAEVLLGYVLDMEKVEIYLCTESAFNDNRANRFRELLMRRAKGEPVAYITGRKEFWSLDFVVTPDVLIPRPETELLVELALEGTVGKAPLKILDIGTGSGAIAITLAKELPKAQIWAVDLSAAALKIAEVNARRHSVTERIQFLHGDLFDPITELGHSFDIIVSNPPYVLTKGIATLAPEIHDWEPKLALDGGPDGLSSYRRIIERAHKYLTFEGRVLLEVGDGLGKAVAELFARAGGFGATTIYRDFAAKDRVIGALKISRLGEGFNRG